MLGIMVLSNRYFISELTDSGNMKKAMPQEFRSKEEAEETIRLLAYMIRKRLIAAKVREKRQVMVTLHD